MAYNFKNLADVELLDNMPETANVLVEVYGATKRAPQKEVDVAAELVAKEALEEVPEGATVLAEVNGEIKRVPGDGLGGIKTAIIKTSDYDNAIAGIQTAEADAVTYECVNMTFEEAYSIMASGKPLNAIVMYVNTFPMNESAICIFAGTAIGMPAIMISYNDNSVGISWTADGLVLAS